MTILKLEKCPIIDAIIEIRFEPLIEKFPNAVFGLIYNSIRTDYPGNVENLPMLQIPEQLRAVDPNFKFKPQYKISNERFTIQIGSDVITISSKIPYVGWEEFHSHVTYLLKKIFDNNIIKLVSRIGHRYINFFEGDIFPDLNVCLQINQKNHITANTHIRTEIPDNTFSNTLQILNNVRKKIIGTTSVGSLIDIDTFKLYKDRFFMDNYRDELNQAHIAEKKLFYLLLKEDFLISLKPVYDGN